MTWVKKFFLFVLILGVLTIVLSPLFRPRGDYIQGNGAERIRVVLGISSEEEDTIDMIVLGDSESYTSMSPMEIWKVSGITSYTGGQPGQRASETYYLLKTAFKTQQPKVVLLETGVLYRYKGNMKSIHHKVVDMIKYYLPLFAYHDRWKALVEEGEDKRVDYKGFRVKDKVVPYTGGDYMFETDEAEPLSDYTQSCLDDILELCRKNNAELVLFSTPSPETYDYRKHNGIAEYAKNESIAYIDLNLEIEELGINWQTDTYDSGNHLNISGASKVSNYMGGYLAENYDIRDKRGDEDYAGWNKLLKEYEDETDPMIERIRSR